MKCLLKLKNKIGACNLLIFAANYSELNLILTLTLLAHMSSNTLGLRSGTIWQLKHDFGMRALPTLKFKFVYQIKDAKLIILFANKTLFFKQTFNIINGY